MTKWCCAGFEAASAAAGDRGIAVVVDEGSGGAPEFYLQARAFASGSEPDLNVEVPMSLVIETGLRFCPWCGARLQRWYRGRASELKRPELRVAGRR